MTEPASPTRRLNAALEGRYEIRRELGEGGMATVYLAQDVKHDRQVAIKVLRPELAAVIGAERFLAEIKTTANLQHPHILPLFDSGEAQGFLYYVMPYIEGENLRDRIEREGQLGVEDAVRIAREVADALDYAHRTEIIHRDIKPANILLHDGRPVVADFGIALAISAAGGGRMTETGMSLGTPHYMSPEQASADRDLTARSDVYSLGCVLYEMLAGQPPHTGPSAQSILVRILTEDPREVSELRRTVPPHVAATVMKAIEKLPADRFGSAMEFKEALEDEGFRYAPAGPRTTASPPGRPTPPASTGPWLSDARSRVAVAVIALLALALALRVFGPGAGRTETAGDPPVRTLLDLGELTTNSPQFYPVTISPDGSRFAVVREGEEGTQIYHRTAEDMEFRVVPGAEGSFINATFSPDGEWIAYSEGDGLYRVSLLGGQPTQLLDADSIRPFLLNWGVEGWIAFWTFESGEGRGPGIFRLPDSGGPVERLVGGPRWEPDGTPFQLPDGSGVLFADRQRGIAVYEFATDSARVLLPTGWNPTYAHSGHLVYIDAGGGLWSAPFDLDANDVTGDPKPVLQGVVTTGRFGSFSISRNGTLVYTSGPSRTGVEARITVADTDGTSSVLDLPARPAFSLRWAPDGRRIAYSGGEPGGDLSGGSAIYVYDTELKNAPTRLTNRGNNVTPVFSPDGSRIVFASNREGTEGFDLFIRNLNDDASPSLLISLPGQQFPTDWPEDSLIVMAGDRAIYTVSLGGDTAGYYAPDAEVDDLRVAPGGGLAAYVSDESGEDEVYVRAFPDPRIETIVSAHRGWARTPWWSDDGRTLYYQTEGDTIWAAEIEVEPTPTVVSRRPLFVESSAYLSDFRSGRFLGARSADEDDASEDDEPIRYVVIHDWFTELERIFGGGR